MTPGVMVADQKHPRVIDQRATHALAARRAESCDQQHIVEYAQQISNYIVLRDDA
jgi:hypothetical protein